ncbi:T9SS type B sorting domain-containing protein, partial [Limnohabitans sp.]
ASAGCASSTVSTTLTIIAVPRIILTSSVASTNQTICVNTAIGNITYTFGGSATGVNVVGLPAGVTASTSGNVVTISGTPTSATAATFNYTITATGSICGTPSLSGSITLTNGIAPIFTQANAVCEGVTINLPTTSNNGITGAWQLISSTSTDATYEFTPDAGQCALNTQMTVQIYPRPVVTATVLPSTGVLCSGDVVDIQLSSNVPGAIFSWTSSSATVTGHSSSVVGSTDTFINQTLVLNSGITGTGEVVYGIVAEANGCVGETVFVTISVNPIPDVTVTGDGQTICSGETTNISFEGTVNNTVFTWVVQSSTGVSGASNGSGSSIAQVLETTGLSQGVVVYQVTPSLNGCVGASATITVYVNPIPELFGSPNHPELCSGVGSTFINFSTFNANTIFTWTVNQVGVTGATADTSTGSTLLIEQVLETTGNTQGYVDYVITPTLNGCSGTSVTVRVYVNPLPQPVLADGTICVDAAGVTFQTYLLDTGLDASMYDFVWYIDGVAQANSDAATFTASVVGVYSVIATNSVTNCVSEEEFAAVTATTPADSFTTLVTDAFSDNATITVTVSGGSGTLLYQLDEGSFQSSNVFTGVSAGEHTVTVIDSEGCTFITQNVTVIDYPKYFTPNGDGHNDTWNIVGMNQADAKLYIFDRYGKLIKQLSATDTSNGWDGTYNGQQLPSTDYWFTLDYTENGAAKQFKAHFSMKR